MNAVLSTTQEDRLWSELTRFVREGVLIPITGSELLEIPGAAGSSKNFYTHSWPRNLPCGWKSVRRSTPVNAHSTKWPAAIWQGSVAGLKSCIRWLRRLSKSWSKAFPSPRRSTIWLHCWSNCSWLPPSTIFLCAPLSSAIRPGLEESVRSSTRPCVRKYPIEQRPPWCSTCSVERHRCPSTWSPKRTYRSLCTRCSLRRLGQRSCLVYLSHALGFGDDSVPQKCCGDR